jgi:hypothetical protein
VEVRWGSSHRSLVMDPVEIRRAAWELLVVIWAVALGRLDWESELLAQVVMDRGEILGERCHFRLLLSAVTIVCAVPQGR